MADPRDRFRGAGTIPSNVTPSVAASAAVDITFTRPPRKLVLQPWGAHTIYARLNATGASATAGDVTQVTAEQPLVIEDVVLASAVPLSIYNAGATTFVWSGVGQNGAILAWF